MPQTKKNTSENVVRAIVQKMESLQLAGVEMIAKAPKSKFPGSAKHTAGLLSPHPNPLPKGEGTLDDSRCAALAEVARDVAACTRCAELVRNRTQTVFGVGNPYARLVFCGEAPGADEDRLGEPFVGRAGQLLTDIVVKGMKMRRQDVYILNILRCRPPGNRNPLPVEAAACREFLDRQLAIIQPEFICCLGAVAAQNLLQTDTPIGRLRGRVLDYHGIKVVCTYHPAYILRNPSAKKFVWDDIQLLMVEMSMDKKDEG
ncbi:MAG: uracil-DNA glycosylase [Thermoguttaceae bacterium]|jgi:DNA polymerase